MASSAPAHPAPPSHCKTKRTWSLQNYFQLPIQAVTGEVICLRTPPVVCALASFAAKVSNQLWQVRIAKNQLGQSRRTQQLATHVRQGARLCGAKTSQPGAALCPSALQRLRPTHPQRGRPVVLMRAHPAPFAVQRRRAHCSVRAAALISTSHVNHVLRCCGAAWCGRALWNESVEPIVLWQQASWRSKPAKIAAQK